MMICPTKKPSTICIYENAFGSTMPGTDINVTPEMLEPIMANATTYQLDLRFPMKNPALSAFRPARCETPKRTRKYAAIVIITANGVIWGPSKSPPRGDFWLVYLIMFCNYL